MSDIEYNFLLFEISEKLDKLYPISRLLFACRKHLSSGSEGNIRDTRSLFEKLEDQEKLDIDNLVVIRGLLKGFREWPLFGKVKRFENKRNEYNALLEEIIRVLDELNDLERLVSICREKLSEESEGLIKDVRSFFKELKNQNILDLDRLDILKEILTETEKNDLLKEVEKLEERSNNEDEFERKKGQAAAYVTSIANWIKAPCVGGVSFVVEKLKSAITLVCNFRTAAGVLLTVNSAMALGKCESLEDCQETFEKVVLPSSAKLIEISNGSVRFTVESENLIALKELWEIYKDGTLQSRLQEFLVTDEIKQLANGEDIEVTVFIDEHEYNEAYFNLSLLHHQAPNVEQEERPGRRTRRNSDSFLCVKPNENEIGLMKLMEETEDKWREEKKMLELRIAELEETLKAERTRDLDRKHLEYEILEHPRKRHRRNSDSNLYCKARKVEAEQTESQLERALEGGVQWDIEKRMFVENYLQNIHETHSMTTETSDSGIRTHGATSEIEMQDISGDDHKLCLKDLNSELIEKLEGRLKNDRTAFKQICRSFGIDRSLFLSRENIFSGILSMFPDTPVKLLKEVFEALQLYDLIDLLEEGKPRATRSLRPVLPLQEIEKLRNPDDRPISYHSSVAVLIIDFAETCDTEGIEKFFKALNTKSEVTVMRCRNVIEAGRTPIWQLRNLEENMKREKNKLSPKVSEVIQSWISNQDKYSLVGLFFIFDGTHGWFSLAENSFVQFVKERLVTAFPTKVKLIIHSSSRQPRLLSRKELVEVSVPFDGDVFLPLMLEIFIKRWQTMDLISMMRELKRSLPGKSIWRGPLLPRDFEEFIIKENLSCLVRFIMHEEPTN